MSEFDSKDIIINKQFELIIDLRKEVSALTELLLRYAKVLLPEDEPFEQRVEIPQEMQSMGREPWYRQKARLEQLHRKSRLSTITGIPESQAGVSQMDIDRDLEELKDDR